MGCVQSPVGRQQEDVEVMRLGQSVMEVRQKAELKLLQ